MSRIAAATLSALAPPPMSRKLAGSLRLFLDQVHRGHGEAGAVDHGRSWQTSSLMKGGGRLRAPLCRGVLVVGSRTPRSSGCRESAESSRVTLASRQTSRSSARAGASVSRTIASGVDLDEVGVAGEHRRDEALGDGDRGLELAARGPSRRQHLRGLPVVEARAGGRRGSGGSRVGLGGDLLNFHATFGRAHEEDSPGRRGRARPPGRTPSRCRRRPRPGPSAR